MWKETVLSTVLILLLLLFINPFEIFGMPSSSQMVLVSIFAALFAVFITFVWQEGGQDERENHHMFLAGRIAFLCGSAILACGIIVQIFLHTLDIWLPLALSGMIFSKIAAVMYYRAKC